ncbi:hypothetical protein CALCODRAFT_368191 [Calocera cornea HHB12733]|uniref:Uncharacterized protein n=1 Tax=Calocera cornea HHB12733 TaxID=1353952 RepID=A0A165EJ80_9BASI|nr:hypothetical protein CALCODRAFT_368191 [Calocera cornea HHB12733]
MECTASSLTAQRNTLCLFNCDLIEYPSLSHVSPTKPARPTHPIQPAKWSRPPNRTQPIHSAVHADLAVRRARMLLPRHIRRSFLTERCNSRPQKIQSGSHYSVLLRTMAQESNDPGAPPPRESVKIAEPSGGSTALRTAVTDPHSMHLRYRYPRLEPKTVLLRTSRCTFPW